MKRLIYILFLLATTACFANDFIKEAEPAVLEVRYTRIEVLDTTKRNDETRRFKDECILRIGKSKSVFCCVKCLWKDSIMAVNPAQFWQAEKASFEKDPQVHSNTIRHGTYNNYIFKNYPEGKLTETAYFDAENWKYAEDMEIPQWELGDSTRTILGYECIEATTCFRGRIWTAWFAPDVPLQDGPWKLCGLPGLILEAYDIHRDYQFTPIAIFQNPTAEVGFFTYNNRGGMSDVNRDKFFNSWWRYTNSNFGAKMSAMHGKTPLPEEKKKHVPHHDKEETDYPHDL